MIYDNLNNPTNLHKHNHDQQPNCGAALTVLGYREDREQVLFSAPDSRFPHSTVTLQPFSWLLSTLIQKPYKLAKHTDEQPPSCEANLIISEQQWGVRFWAPYCRSQILFRSSMHVHKNWSTAMTIAQKNWKYIPTTDDPGVKPAWLF